MRARTGYVANIGTAMQIRNHDRHERADKYSSKFESHVGMPRAHPCSWQTQGPAPSFRAICPTLPINKQTQQQADAANKS